MSSVTSGRGRSQGGVFGGNGHSYKDFLFQGARRKRNLHQGKRTIFLESPLVILSTAPPTDSLPHLLNHLLNHPLTYSLTIHSKCHFIGTLYMLRHRTISMKQIVFVFYLSKSSYYQLAANLYTRLIRHPPKIS